jgi:hypothetical protein
LEVKLSRIINPDGAGKIRTRLTKEVVLAIRELMRQTQPDEHSRDLAAFIVLAMEEINESVESSVAAWEKRGYWVKADRYRMEWAWAGQQGSKMKRSLIAEDWAGIAVTAVQIGQKLMSIEVSVHHRLGEPWVGAWLELKRKGLPG